MTLLRLCGFTVGVWLMQLCANERVVAVLLGALQRRAGPERALKIGHGLDLILEAIAEPAE